MREKWERDREQRETESTACERNMGKREKKRGERGPLAGRGKKVWGGKILFVNIFSSVIFLLFQNK